MKPKPIKNFLLIKQIKKDYKGGLIDPRGEDDKRLEVAEVLEVGRGCEEVKKGQKVIFKSYNLFVVEISKDNELCFLQEDEVLAIV